MSNSDQGRIQDDFGDVGSIDQIIVLTLRTQTDRSRHRLIRVYTVFHSPSNFTRIHKK